MSRRSKDCPKCRLTAHEGLCTWCQNRGSVPMEPPLAETVIYHAGNEKNPERLPMTVMGSKVEPGKRGEAEVILEGWVLARRPKFDLAARGHQPFSYVDSIPGPREELGCWSWKGKRS